MPTLSLERVAPARLEESLQEIEHRMQDPLIVFVSGAAGSGKSRTCSELAKEASHCQMVWAEFDAEREIPRWNDRVHLFKAEGHFSEEANELAIREALRAWSPILRTRFHDKRVVIADVNASFEIIVESAHAAGISGYAGVLLQPCEAVRCQRLTEDPRRKAPENRKTLEEQMKPDYSETLAAQAKKFGFAHISSAESQTAIAELGGVILRSYKAYNW